MLKLKMYINGEWTHSSSKKKSKIINPANKEVIAEAESGNSEDAKNAIHAAREAFDSRVWADTSAAERADLLFQIADKIAARKDEIIHYETLNNGKTLRESSFDVDDAIECFRYYGGLITKPNGQVLNVPLPFQTTVVHEPIGVCSLIVPWNHPFLMSAWKIAPALAAGNSIVFKPAEITPITAVFLFEIMEEVGIPKGVVNLITGRGREIGNEMTSNPNVDKISLIGGTNTGKQVMKAAAENVIPVSLELGGKSSNIIFSDTDLEIVVDYALYGMYFGSGQVCSAGTRILVQEDIFQQFIERFKERANKIKIGPGIDPSSEMGPLVSEQQMNNVLNYIKIGTDEGAELLCGGHQLKDHQLEDGYFVAPTAFINVTPDMRIVQEEIFGPVAVIQSFKDEQEAIELANQTNYGLAGSVFTNDGARAHRVIRQMKAGITYVNTYHLGFIEAPWGGYKQSGIGRGLGTFGLAEFQETKQININTKVEAINWFKN